MWKTASASPPSGEDDPGASRRPHPQRTLHKDRTGGDLFLFTHLTVERCPFLFIYLSIHFSPNSCRSLFCVGFVTRGEGGGLKIPHTKIVQGGDTCP